MRGWYRDNWRHSLAAKGIRTSFIAYRIPLSGVYSVELNPIRGKGRSKKAELEDEIDWTETVIQDLKKTIEGTPEDKKSDLEQRLSQLEQSLDNLKNKYKRITGRPPVHTIGAASWQTPEQLKEQMLERYKGRSTKPPELVTSAVGEESLREEEPVVEAQDIQARQRKKIYKREHYAEEKAVEELVSQGMEQAAEKEPEDVDVEISEDTLKDRRERGDLFYGAKRIFKKGKVHTTLSGPEVKRLASNIKHRLEPLSNKIEIAGSIRRKVDSPVDVDVVLIPKDKDKVKETMRKLGRVTAEGSTMIETKVKGVDVDVYFAEPDTYGAQLMTRTGPWQGNIGNRTLAKNKGMRLNQYGLWKGSRKIAGRTEKQIYEALGKKYKEPELRGR